MKTIENNILLAEFLGEITKDANGNIKEDVKLLDFHNNWNSLIRFVKEALNRTMKFNIDFYSDWLDVFNENLIKLDINILYSVCVEYANWFNQQK